MLVVAEVYLRTRFSKVGHDSVVCLDRLDVVSLRGKAGIILVTVARGQGTW